MNILRRTIVVLIAGIAAFAVVYVHSQFYGRGYHASGPAGPFGPDAPAPLAVGSTAGRSVALGGQSIPRPSRLTAEAGDRVVLLTWPAPPHHTVSPDYEILRSTSATGPFTPITRDPVKTDAYLDCANGAVGLANGTTYFYATQVIERGGARGPRSAVVEATPQQTPGFWLPMETGQRGPVTAAASVSGPDRPRFKTVPATLDQTWVATWFGRPANSWPGLFVVEEYRFVQADVDVQADTRGKSPAVIPGLARAMVISGREMLASVSLARKARFTNTNAAVDGVDDGDPGHYDFSFERKAGTESFKPSTTGAADHAYHYGDVTMTYHVFTAAYFRAHFAGPESIALAFPSTGDVTSYVTLSERAAGKAVATGRMGDTYHALFEAGM